MKEENATELTSDSLPTHEQLEELHQELHNNPHFSPKHDYAQQHSLSTIQNAQESEVPMDVVQKESEKRPYELIFCESESPSEYSDENSSTNHQDNEHPEELSGNESLDIDASAESQPLSPEVSPAKPTSDSSPEVSVEQVAEDAPGLSSTPSASPMKGFGSPEISVEKSPDRVTSRPGSRIDWRSESRGDWRGSSLAFQKNDSPLRAHHELEPPSPIQKPSLDTSSEAPSELFEHLDDSISPSDFHPNIRHSLQQEVKPLSHSDQDTGVRRLTPRQDLARAQSSAFMKKLSKPTVFDMNTTSDDHDEPEAEEIEPEPQPQPSSESDEAGSGNEMESESQQKAKARRKMQGTHLGRQISQLAAPPLRTSQNILPPPPPPAETVYDDYEDEGDPEASEPKRELEISNEFGSEPDPESQPDSENEIDYGDSTAVSPRTRSQSMDYLYLRTQANQSPTHPFLQQSQTNIDQIPPENLENRLLQGLVPLEGTHPLGLRQSSESEL